MPGMRTSSSVSPVRLPRHHRLAPRHRRQAPTPDLGDSALMAGMLTKRAVSATLWKNWRPRYIVLRPGWVEWHKWIVDEDARADLPAGKMHFHHTSVASAGGDRAHCLTISTAGPVLRLDPIRPSPGPDPSLYLTSLTLLAT